MAVGYSDNRFDWCDEILEVKRNYSNDECCNIVKNVIKAQKGADLAFVKDICARNNSTFKISRRFYPVYSTNFTVTYDWDEESTKDKGGYTVTTTTHHTNTKTYNHDFYTAIYNSCCPNSFVGRNDERFYRLSHVDDLDSDLYNSGCVYSCNGLEMEIKSYASKNKPDYKADYLLNRWSVTVLFVPMAVISYDYNGKTYTSVVNMHNGQSHVNYIISKAVEEKSKKARTMSIVLKTCSMVLSAICFLILMSKGFFPFVFSAGILAGNVAATIAVKHPVKYFYNEYGSKGVELGAKVLKSEITQIILTVIGVILTFILF